MACLMDTRLQLCRLYSFLTLCRLSGPSDVTWSRPARARSARQLDHAARMFGCAGSTTTIIAEFVYRHLDTVCKNEQKNLLFYQSKPIATQYYWTLSMRWLCILAGGV